MDDFLEVFFSRHHWWFLWARTRGQCLGGCVQCVLLQNVFHFVLNSIWSLKQILLFICWFFAILNFQSGFEISFSSMFNSVFRNQLWWNYNVDEFHKETFLLLNKIGLMEDPLFEKQGTFCCCDDSLRSRRCKRKLAEKCFWFQYVKDDVENHALACTDVRVSVQGGM